MIKDIVNKVSWYPGHMHRGMKLLIEYIPKTDVFIEVRDARVPLSSFNTQIDELVKIHKKQKIILFNKYDLCDHTKTDKVTLLNFHTSFIFYFISDLTF